MNLKITPSDGRYITFSEPIFPAPVMYFDKSSDQKLEVFSDKFTVFIPFVAAEDLGPDKSVDAVITYWHRRCGLF